MVTWDLNGTGIADASPSTPYERTPRQNPLTPSEVASSSTRSPDIGDGDSVMQDPHPADEGEDDDDDDVIIQLEENDLEDSKAFSQRRVSPSATASESSHTRPHGIDGGTRQNRSDDSEGAPDRGQEEAEAADYDFEHSSSDGGALGLLPEEEEEIEIDEAAFADDESDESEAEPTIHQPQRVGAQATQGHRQDDDNDAALEEDGEQAEMESVRAPC